MPGAAPNGIADALGIANPGGGPLAEIWMGAHPSAPSTAIVDGSRVGLDELVRRDPAAALGPKVLEKLGPTLPFLFKVLSAGTPLSIQAHPSKRKAQLGYERENLGGIPVDAAERNYRDPNHKPEMAVALTRFELICGFRPVAEIIANMRLAAPGEFERSLERLERDPSRVELSVFFYGLVSADARSRSSLLDSAAKKIAEALDAGSVPADRADAFRWVLKIMEFFPGDVGAIMPLILNHVVLEPGQAAFIAPGELHAHLTGTCLEIMANSDNVIRGALTPEIRRPARARLGAQLQSGKAASGPAFRPRAVRGGVPDLRARFRDVTDIGRAGATLSKELAGTGDPALRRGEGRDCLPRRAWRETSAQARRHCLRGRRRLRLRDLARRRPRRRELGSPRLSRLRARHSVTIWADGDSLQAELRALLCRRANREAAAAAAEDRATRFRAVFVAARMPPLDMGPGVEAIVVADDADSRIAADSKAGDLAVTRDLPLAERLAEKGLRVLNDRGEVFTAENARERRSLRDRAVELRALGLAPESPRGSSWGARELRAFADALDREIAKAIKKF